MVLDHRMEAVTDCKSFQIQCPEAQSQKINIIPVHLETALYTELPVYPV